MFNSIHQEDNQIYCEISNINSRDDKEEKINNNNHVTNEKSTNKENQILNETKKEIKNKDENKVKGKIKNRIIRGNNNLKKNFDLDIHKEEIFQTSSKILDLKILGGGSCQTSPENFNSRITEIRFQTSLVNSTPVDCEEGSN